VENDTALRFDPGEKKQFWMRVEVMDRREE
jgi:hypothetical protein